MIRHAIALLAVALPLAAAPAPTFNEHIAPVVFSKCSVCHRDGQVAPFSLLNYAQVKKRAKQIVEVTGNRVMPPWHADPGVVTYANDRSLSAEQIVLFRNWLEAGTPEGDAAKLPPLPKFPAGWQLGKPDFIAEMPEAFTVPAEGPDIYRNFVLPLNRTEDTWVNGIELVPGDASVVHHVLYFLDTTGSARRDDAADPAPGYNGMSRANAKFRYLGGWDVGTQTARLGHGLAWLVPAGADLVIQVHYHPTGKETQDRSQLGFFLSGQPTARPWSVVAVPPYFGILSGIHIPAGQKEYIKQSSFVLPVDIEAFAVNAHAHYLGRRMELTATLPGGEKRWLLKMSDWNFAWQEDYAFPAPVRLPAGTRLDALISWDNSAENPRQAVSPPREVKWGPTSTDEMGTITLSVMMNTAPEKAALHEALTGMLTRQFVERVFENDAAAIAAVRRQIAGEKYVPGPVEFQLLRTMLVQPLDKNKDGKLEDAEIQPGLTAVRPFMKGFWSIGID